MDGNYGLDINYCRFEGFIWNNNSYTWDTFSEIIETFNKVIERVFGWCETESNRMKMIGMESNQDNKKNYNTVEFGKTSINLSVVLYNRWQEALQIGVSEEGCLLLLMKSGKTSSLKIAKFDDQGNDKFVSFLLPEPTEFGTHYLVPKEITEQIIQDWLESGQIKYPELFG